MSDRTFTFFKLHLHDGFSLTNTAPFKGSKSAESDGGNARDQVEVEGTEEAQRGAVDTDVDDETDDSSGGSVLKRLFVLLLLVGVAVAEK